MFLDQSLLWSRKLEVISVMWAPQNVRNWRGHCFLKKLILCCILCLHWISQLLFIMDFASGYCFLEGSVESKNQVKIDVLIFNFYILSAWL